jgi:hypothetical protein
MSRPPDPAVEAAAAGRATIRNSERPKQRPGKKRQPRAPPKRHTDVIGAYSIPDFCRAHGGISEAYFHMLVKDGLGPDLMKVGNRTLVSIEAAAAWRRKMETMTKRQQGQAAAHAEASV